MNISKIILLYFISCLFNQSIAQQPFTLDKNIRPIEIKFEDYKKGDAKMSGKMGTVKVRQNKDTLYYYVKGVGIYQTVMVAIGNKNPKQVLDVSLSKDSWNKPDRKAKVETKPYYEKFRTEGGFGIRIIAKRASEYGIAVWISDEPKIINMPTAFKMKTTKPSKK
jgi:hypothetical protein